MARIDPADLTGFLAVARELNFRRAAVALGVTPSALSHAMRTLEERIEVRLVNRTTRSVSLTEAGRNLAARVNAALHDWERSLGLRDRRARELVAELDELTAVLEAEGSTRSGRA